MDFNKSFTGWKQSQLSMYGTTSVNNDNSSNDDDDVNDDFF